MAMCIGYISVNLEHKDMKNINSGIIVCRFFHLYAIVFQTLKSLLITMLLIKFRTAI